MARRSVLLVSILSLTLSSAVASADGIGSEVKAGEDVNRAAAPERVERSGPETERTGERADFGRGRAELRGPGAGERVKVESQLSEAFRGERGAAEKVDEKATESTEKVKGPGFLRRFGSRVARSFRTFGASERVTEVTERVHAQAKEGSIAESARTLQEAPTEKLGVRDRVALALAERAVKGNAFKQLRERGRQGDSGYDRTGKATAGGVRDAVEGLKILNDHGQLGLLGRFHGYLVEREAYGHNLRMAGAHLRRGDIGGAADRLEAARQIGGDSKRLEWGQRVLASKSGRLATKLARRGDGERAVAALEIAFDAADKVGRDKTHQGVMKDSLSAADNLARAGDAEGALNALGIATEAADAGHVEAGEADRAVLSGLIKVADKLYKAGDLKGATGAAAIASETLERTGADLGFGDRRTWSGVRSRIGGDRINQAREAIKEQRQEAIDAQAKAQETARAAAADAEAKRLAGEKSSGKKDGARVTKAETQRARGILRQAELRELEKNGKLKKQQRKELRNLDRKLAKP